MSGPYSERPREHRGATELLSAGTARALTGKGGLILLRGATGTGRTTVLEAAVEAAGGHGMRVLRARCSPGDAWTPFAAVVQLLRSGAGSRESDTAGAVCEGAEPWVAGPDRPGPERAVPGSEGPRTTGDARCAGGADDDAAGERERGDRLRRALLAHAEESPLLVAVDDVHLADAPSYRWLVETARHVDRLRLPVLLAVTERSQYDVDPPAPGFGRGLSPALVRTHTLAPPAADSAAGLVRARFPSATGAWVDACVRAGAASPLLLRALLDDLDASGPPPAVPESAAALYPGAYAAAVSWWLENAGAGTTEVARVLAALDEEPEREPAGHPEPSGDGRPAERPGRLLAELAGADPARVSGWLTAMTGLGLLRTGTDGRPRYAHPLLRDAVLACVPTHQRYAVRAAAAAVTLHRGAPAETVAGHLLLTGPVGEPWAPSVLHGAATAALGAGRTDDAAAYLRRALDEPLPAEHRQRLLTELGSLEYAGSRSSAAIPRFTEALALAGTPRERVSAAVALGTALADRGSTRAALEVLRTADGQLAGHPGLASTLQGATLFLSDHDKTIRREIYQWLRHTADRNPELVSPAAQALLVRYASTAGLISAREAMRRVRVLLAEPSDPLAEPFLLGAAATVAQWADELDEAQELVSRGLAGQSPHLPHPMHLALLNVRTDIAAARGEFTRLPAGDPAGADGGLTQLTPAHAHTLTGLVEAGRATEARRLANAFDLRELPDSWGRNRLLYARGIQRASDGDPAGALHDFLECGRRQSERQVVSPVVTPWRTAAALCCLVLGSPGQALALAEEELRLARVWGTARPVGRALRVFGTVTGGRRGLRLSEEAVRLLRDSPAEVGTELVSALLAHGRAQTAAGEHAHARRCLREAVERAERLGAVRLRTLAEQALRESGARRPTRAGTGAHSLTASERRIARLAADGHTNTEIADLLHLARRTVETHLTNTYRKLGIRRRVELLASLDAD